VLFFSDLLPLVVLAFAEIVQSNVGERVWLTWIADDFKDNFRVLEVDRCIAGSREDRQNDKPPVGA